MIARRHIAAALLAANAAVGLALALVVALDRPTAPARGVAVPFQMLPSNHMVVQAKVNGKGPFRLIFDLGAPITLLSNRAGEAAGGVKKGAPKSFLFSMRGEASVETLEVGGLKARDLPVIVLDHPALR